MSNYKDLKDMDIKVVLNKFLKDNGCVVMDGEYNFLDLERKVKYLIQRSIIESFLELYTECLKTGVKLHFIQPQFSKNSSNPYTQLNIDIDMKFKQKSALPTNSFYNQMFLIKLCQKIEECLNIYIEDFSISQNTLFIFEKKYYKKREEEEYYKNGVHIQIPSVYLEKEEYFMFLKLLSSQIQNDDDLFLSLKNNGHELITARSSLIDLVHNWMFYGSCKPDDTYAYRCNRIYTENGIVECKTTDDLVSYINIEVWNAEDDNISLNEKLKNPSLFLCRVFNNTLVYRNKQVLQKKLRTTLVPNNDKKKQKNIYSRFLELSPENEEHESTEEIQNDNLYKNCTIDLDEFKSFLDDIGVLASSDYNTWMKILFCIYNIFSSKGKKVIRDLCHYFSSKDQRKYDKNTVDKFVNDPHDKYGCGFPTLFKICIEYNLTDAYDKLQKIHNNSVKKHRNIKVERVDLEQYLNRDMYIVSTNRSEHDYFMGDLLRDLHNWNKKSLELHEYLEQLLPKLTSVCCRILKQSCYMVKTSYEEQSQLINKLEDHPIIYKKLDEDGNDKYINQPFASFVRTQTLHYLRLYNTFDFIPCSPMDNPRNDPRIFNIWKGFQAKLIPQNEIDMGKIELILYHLKYVWCDGNQEHFDYLLGCYFKPLFTMPHIKTGVAINLVGEQGVGKTMIIDDFLIPYVFGEYSSTAVTGLSKLVQRFNNTLMGKLFISVNELPNIDVGKKDGFDTLKSLITDRRITIEPKGVNPFEMSNYTRYMFSTNNDMSIHLEIGDRRFFCLKVSQKHKNDITYFTKLSKTFTQETANHFFSYCFWYESNQNSRVVPMTKLKEEMTITCCPNPIKFLHNLKELLTINDNEVLIKSFIQHNNTKIVDEKKNPVETILDQTQNFSGEISTLDNPEYFNTILHEIKLKIDDEKEYYVSSTTLFNWYKLYCTEENEKPYSQITFTKTIKEKVIFKRTTWAKTCFNIFSIKSIV